MSLFDDTIIPETLYDADGNRFRNGSDDAAADADELIFGDLGDLAEPHVPAAGGAAAAHVAGRGSGRRQPQAPAYAADMAAAILL